MNGSSCCLSCSGGAPMVRVLLLSVLCQILLGSSLLAEKAPLSPARLVEESDLVVLGQITDLKIRSERSHIEQGFGNYDWAIYVTIRITKVEKGGFDGSDTIIARCFRIKTRKSLTEYLTPSGNRPIPNAGTTVRAHLYRDRNSDLWRVVFPNGFAPVSDGTQLSDANAIRNLKSGRFTYLLPIEYWGVVLASEVGVTHFKGLGKLKHLPLHGNKSSDEAGRVRETNRLGRT